MIDRAERSRAFVRRQGQGDARRRGRHPARRLDVDPVEIVCVLAIGAFLGLWLGVRLAALGLLGQ